MKKVVMKKELLFPTLCLGVGKGQGHKTINVGIELRETQYRNWDTMEMENGYELSICVKNRGYGLYYFKKHAEQYMIDENRRELFNRLFDIWDEYHMNTMEPGTKWQTEMYNKLRENCIKEKPELAKEFNDSYAIITKGALANISMGIVNGYKPLMYDHARGDYRYGSAWLGKPIPKDIIEEILSWNEIENYTKDELEQIKRKLIREYKNKANLVA